MLVASVRAREICSNPLCSNRVAMDSELHRTVSPATLEPEPTGEARGSYMASRITAGVLHAAGVLDAAGGVAADHDV